MSSHVALGRNRSSWTVSSKPAEREVPLTVKVTKNLAPNFQEAVQRWSRVMVGPGMDSLSPMSVDFLKQHNKESALVTGELNGEPAFISRITFRRDRSGADILQAETTVGNQPPIRLPVNWGFLNLNRVNPELRRRGLGTLNIALRCQLARLLGHTHVSTLIVPNDRWWGFWRDELGFTIERRQVMCCFDGVNVCQAIYIRRALDRELEKILGEKIQAIKLKLADVGVELKLTRTLQAAQILLQNNIKIGERGFRLRV